MGLQQSSRIAWIDNAKAIVMICVIIGHVSSSLVGTFSLPTGNTFVLTLMPLFVMLSGYVNYGAISRIKEYNELKIKVYQFLLRIKMPSFVFSLFYFPFTLSYRDLNPVISRYWFCDMLLLLFTAILIIKVLLEKNTSDKILFPLTIICFLALLLWIPIHGICDFCVFYVIGILLRKHDAINKFTQNTPLLILTIITILNSAAF